MLTPAFELFQDEVFLTILIKAPFTKVSETEIFIEDNDFKFYSKPYFLRLNLPGKIVEDGQEEANYDADKGTFTVKVPKQTKGEVFEGLDMLTKLLAPKGQTSAHQPVIEVLAEENMLPSDALPEEEEIDWSVEQNVFTESESLTDGYKYGFACQRSGVFKRLQSELCEVVEVRDPDSLSPDQRSAQRKEQEDDSFNDDHYLADLYQDEMVQEVIKYRPPWCQAWRQLAKRGKRKEIVVFTEEEKEKMRKLPNKEYLIDSCQMPGVYLNLVDIIFAYAFSLRASEGEHNVESGWTITKLSATLSWLEVFGSLREVLITCYRRCLCFPLYRHWTLLETVKQDTHRIFSLGRRQVLKCLLDIQTVLTDTDQRYVLNDLYINDYCVWIQGVSNSKLGDLANAIEKLEIRKSDVGFSLVELEEAAEMAIQEEEAGGIVGKLEKLAVSGTAGQDSDDENTESEDSDDESSDSDEYTESDDENTKSDEKDSKGDGNINSYNDDTKGDDTKGDVTKCDENTNGDENAKGDDENRKCDDENAENDLSRRVEITSDGEGTRYETIVKTITSNKTSETDPKCSGNKHQADRHNKDCEQTFVKENGEDKRESSHRCNQNPTFKPTQPADLPDMANLKIDKE